MDIKKPQKENQKLTDTERHKRFVETAKKLETSEKIDAFDKAFERIVIKRPKE